MNSETELIYKVFTRKQWNEARRTGIFHGAPVDLQDGFIHFSLRHQVEETVAKHFRGQKELFLVSFRSEPFGDKLKWEVSRGGDRFPHLYDTLDITLVEDSHELEDLEDGGHRFPEMY